MFYVELSWTIFTGMATTDIPIRTLYVGSKTGDLTPGPAKGADPGITFETTATASDALARLSESAFDCVVSEYDLPDTDGIELLESVRAERPELPFIIYTDSGSEAVASRATQSGVTVYLPKRRGTDDDGPLREQIASAVGSDRSSGAGRGDTVGVESPDRGSLDGESQSSPDVSEGATGRFDDVTNRADWERKLAFFKQLVETAGTGIGIYDENGEFIYVNQACRELLGVDEGSLEGMTVWELNPEFDRERFNAYWDSVSIGDVRTTETTLSVGNRTVPIEAITTKQEIQGDVYHFGTISDRTAWREYERELERRNERLEQFASVVSHDLRSPLSVARGRLALARMDPDDEHFDEIERAHGRMDTLIENILTLAREGEAEPDRGPVALGELATDCWSTVETTGGALAIETERTIHADESRVKRLLENLFRNSVEHNAADVTITVGPLEEGFYVEDDGFGIPESDRSDVFKTGYSTNTDGTGFGLAIVKRIAEAHGWTIEITEGTDGGARFELTGVEFVD